MNKHFLGYLSLLFFSVQVLPSNAKTAIDIYANSVLIDEQKGLSIYTGDVKVTQGELVLKAEKIQLFNTQRQVTKIIANGTKNQRAYYKQGRVNKPRFIEARADNITYFIKSGLVRLNGRANLIQGFDSFSGGTLDYDIKNDKVIVKQSKDGTQRVKFKIKL